MRGTRRQDHIHDMQAGGITQARPHRDLGAGAQATQAQSIVTQGADAGARAKSLPDRRAERQPEQIAETAGLQDESEFAAPGQLPDPTIQQGELLHGLNAAEKLNRRIMDAWPTIAATGSISRQEYQILAGKDISMRTAQYDLQLLVQQGLVRKEGRGPAQRYVVIGR